MHCPHCGTENDDANRFCVGCGSALSKRSTTAANSVPWRERVRHLVGTTPRARLLTATTAVAIVVAIAAFVALKPSDESVIEDSYLRGVDSTCVAEKERISSLERETLQQQPPNIAEFASVLVTIVAEWRSSLQATPVPPIHAEGVRALDSALRGVLIGAGGLARVTREQRRVASIAARAQSVDKTTATVDRVIGELGLARCMDLPVGPAVVSGP
jgi:zinc-ribbon domain